jgi:predicted metalloprotease with PDZ domain
VAWSEESPNWSARLGLRVNEAQGIVVKQVMRGSAAEAAGICAGDEWIGAAALTPKRTKAARGTFWRMHKLDELGSLFAGVDAVQVWVARDREMLELRLELPKQAGALARPVRLSWLDASKASGWGPVAPKA